MSSIGPNFLPPNRPVNNTPAANAATSGTPAQPAPSVRPPLLLTEPPLVEGRQGSIDTDFIDLQRTLEIIGQNMKQEKPPVLPPFVDILKRPPNVGPPPPNTGIHEVDHKEFVDYLEKLGKEMTKPTQGLLTSPFVVPPTAP